MGEIVVLRDANRRELQMRVRLCDRQGKNFTKPFNLTLAIVFLTAELYWLSHRESWEISEKVVLPPK